MNMSAARGRSALDADVVEAVADPGEMLRPGHDLGHGHDADPGGARMPLEVAAEIGDGPGDQQHVPRAFRQPAFAFGQAAAPSRAAGV
jgi:hypothetical protein